MLIQTNPYWKLFVVHDGPASKETKLVMSHYINEARIHFIETQTISGVYGHPNRKMMLGHLPNNHTDFVMMTNDDNYYVPVFVEYMLRGCGSMAKKIGMVYCDTVHSYLKYEVMITQVKENYIDMGSFIVRMDVAKKIGFNQMHLSADGAFAVKCAELCARMRLNIVHIKKPLFVHN